MDICRYGSLGGLLFFTGLVAAHGGHESVPEGSTISLEPIVRANLVSFLLYSIAH